MGKGERTDHVRRRQVVSARGQRERIREWSSGEREGKSVKDIFGGVEGLMATFLG